MEPNIEKFDTNNVCGFNPEGTSRLSCVDRCHSQKRLKSISSLGNDYLNNCQRIHCDKICDNCDNDYCEWKQEDEFMTPLQTKINGIEGNGQIKITWIPPISKLPITGYTLVIDNHDHNDTSRLDFHSDPECNMCDYIIKGLTNGETYDIYLMSSNKLGASPKSNELNLTPKDTAADFEDPNEDSKVSHWSEDVLNYKEQPDDTKIITNRNNDYAEFESLFK